MKYSFLFLILLMSFSIDGKVFKGSLTLNDNIKADVAVAYFEHEDYNKVPIKVDQLRRVFLQALYVSQPGADVTLANSDRTRHNIFINDLGLGLKLNTGIMRRNQSKQFSIDWQSGYIVRLGCFLHSTMISYLANIPSNYYDTMVFDNNHPISPFTVEPVDYAFDIQVPDDFKARVLSLILPYKNVDPIVLDKQIPATYNLESEGRVIGKLSILGIADDPVKDERPEILKNKQLDDNSKAKKNSGTDKSVNKSQQG